MKQLMVLLASCRSQYNRKISALFFNVKKCCVGGRFARTPAPKNPNKPMRLWLSQKLARTVVWPGPQHTHTCMCALVYCTVHAQCTRLISATTILLSHTQHDALLVRVWEEGHCYAVREGVLIWARYITQIYERPQNQLLPIVHLRLPYRETRELALVNAFGVTRRGLYVNEKRCSGFRCQWPHQSLISK